MKTQNTLKRKTSRMSESEQIKKLMNSQYKKADVPEEVESESDQIKKLLKNQENKTEILENVKETNHSEDISTNLLAIYRP